MSQEDFDNLYFYASKQIREYAKQLRKNMTPAEKLLWEKLRNRQIANCKFRRQHPIDIFIADFYCPKKRLVIELDGEIHKFQKQYDINRTAELKNYEITVIRFSNKEVENNINDVVEKIRSVCEKL